MIDHGRISMAARNAVYGFLLLSASMLSTAILQKNNVVGSASAQRVLGILLGVLIMMSGNYVPKTHPLKALGWNSASAFGAERWVGWTLFLGGAVDACAFAFAPLRLARPASAYVAGSIVPAILFVFVGFFVWRSTFSTRNNIDGKVELNNGEAQISERTSLAILLAVTWILFVAFAKYLRSNPSWGASPFASVLLGTVFVAVIPLLKSMGRPKNKV